MITVKLLGGFGNQLFQWAYGKSLEARGYQVVYDKSSLIEGTHREYSLGMFDLVFGQPEGPIVTEMSHSFSEMMQHPLDPSTILAYVQSEKYFSNIASDIRSKMNHVWMTTPWSPSGKFVWEEVYKAGNSVSLHVRRQDYVNLQHFHGMPGIKYYREAVQRIRYRMHDPKFFIFSDDPDWCEENFPCDSPAYFKDFKIVRGLSKYEDLRLMAGCKHAITANSSFSWWGAWLGDNQIGRMVISPEHWFADPMMDDTDIVPARWIKL